MSATSQQCRGESSEPAILDPSKQDGFAGKVPSPKNGIAAQVEAAIPSSEARSPYIFNEPADPCPSASEFAPERACPEDEPPNGIPFYSPSRCIRMTTQ